MVENLASSRKRVAAAARAALAAGFEGRPERVPEVLVIAVADGRGDPESVARATREAFGDRPPLELVLFDTDQIGQYVFESSRPPVISGASRILERLNQRIGEKYRRYAVFSGGGEGILLAPAGEGEAICAEIEEMYDAETEGALGVTTDHTPVLPADFLGTGGEEAEPAGGVQLVSGTPAVLARVRDRIRDKKQQRLPSLNPVEGGKSRCISCRDRAGAVAAKELRKGLPGELCRPCARRWRVGRSLIAGVSFEAMIKAFAGNGDASRSKESYLGFLYADGNAMGNLFGRLRSLAELRFLSQAVAHTFKQVHDRAVDRAREITPAGGEEEPSFLSFLGGGDEAIWILPAPVAVSVAEDVAAWVESEAAAVPGLGALLERAGLKRLTVGTGLVLCEHKYPVRYQFELAKDLQKSAKKPFYKMPPRDAPSFIDFEVLTDASPASEDLDDARSLAYGTEEARFSRTCRPYAAEGFRKLLDCVRKAGASGVGKAQLYALQTGAAEGKRLFLNYLLYQIVRNRKRYQPWLGAMQVDLYQPGALEGFFVHPRENKREATWIPDALQLAPFLGNSKGARS